MKIISEFGGKLQIGLQWSAPRRKNPTTSEANINACHNSLNNLPQSLHAWEGKKQCVVLCAQLTDKLQGGGQLMDLPHSSGLVTNPIFVDTPSYRTNPPNVAGTLSGLSLYIQASKCGWAEHIGNVPSDLLGYQRNHLSDHLLGIHSHPPAMKHWHIRPWRNKALVLRAQAVLKHLEVLMLRKLLIFQR